VRVERHTNVEALAPEWDALADRVRAHPFLRPGWIGPWLRAFGTGSLDLFAARRDGRLVAVLPLQRRRGALSAPTNWHTPMGGILAEDDEARDAVIGAALATRPRKLSLGFLRGGEAVEAAAARARYTVMEQTLQRSPTLALDGDWQGYLAELGGKRTKVLRRRRRKLEELGEVRLEVDESIDRLEEGLEIEGSGWKVEQGTAILADPAVATFYRQVAVSAARRGVLRLFFLRLDERPVAFQYALVDDGVFYNVKSGYDPDFRTFGPGLLITSDMLEWSFRQGLDRFEFLGKEEPQKLHWTNDVHDLRRVQAFAPTAAGRVERLAWVYLRPLARRLVRRLRHR
jgi:CelD/BcsL family acetyltransferase involved in cellulose biosynthesis